MLQEMIKKVRKKEILKVILGLRQWSFRNVLSEPGFV